MGDEDGKKSIDEIVDELEEKILEGDDEIAIDVDAAPAPEEPEIPDDEIFADDKEDILKEAVKHAEHLRTCPQCRSKLIRHAKPIAKLTLAITQKELGREVLGETKKALAKALLVRASLEMGLIFAVLDKMGKERGIGLTDSDDHVDVEQAASVVESVEGEKVIPVYGFRKPPKVGEA